MAPTSDFPYAFQSLVQNVAPRTATQDASSNPTMIATIPEASEKPASNLIILAVVIGGIGLIAIFAGAVIARFSCCTKCCGTSRGHNSSIQPQETVQAVTETPNRWYNRRKSQISPLASRHRCPEDILLERVMSAAQRRSSARQAHNRPRRPAPASVTGAPTTRPPWEAPPEYQPASLPAPPRGVYLNSTRNASRMTLNSVQTTTTLPPYHRSHRDRPYYFVDETDAAPDPPPYARNWNPWATPIEETYPRGL